MSHTEQIQVQPIPVEKPKPLPVKKPSAIPYFNPELEKDLLAYLEAMELLNEMRIELKKMAAGLKDMHNVMYGVIEIMGMFQNIEGAKVRALSAVDNIDSDLRSAVTGGQGDVNGIAGGQINFEGKGKDKHIVPTKQEVEEAKKLIAFVDEIQAFINAHGGAKGIVGDSVLKNLQEAINSIKDQFKNKANGKTHDWWGHPTAMARWILSWVQQSKGGVYSPKLKNLQFAFQELNQTTSALSTTTNTNLQFTTEMFKQFLGIDESAMQSYQKGIMQTIQNQRSS